MLLALNTGSPYRLRDLRFEMWDSWFYKQTTGYSFSEHGVGHISTRQFELNTDPMYDGINCSKIGFDVRRSNESFFTVFGVFFANFLGVLAGSYNSLESTKEIPHHEDLGADCFTKGKKGT